MKRMVIAGLGCCSAALLLFVICGGAAPGGEASEPRLPTLKIEASGDNFIWEVDLPDQDVHWDFDVVTSFMPGPSINRVEEQRYIGGKGNLRMIAKLKSVREELLRGEDAKGLFVVVSLYASVSRSGKPLRLVDSQILRLPSATTQPAMTELPRGSIIITPRAPAK